jgi:hypothetical protein
VEPPPVNDKPAFSEMDKRMQRQQLLAIILANEITGTATTAKGSAAAGEKHANYPAAASVY